MDFSFQSLWTLKMWTRTHWRCEERNKKYANCWLSFFLSVCSFRVANDNNFLIKKFCFLLHIYHHQFSLCPQPFLLFFIVTCNIAISCSFISKSSTILSTRTLISQLATILMPHWNWIINFIHKSTKFLCFSCDVDRSIEHDKFSPDRSKPVIWK